MRRLVQGGEQVRVLVRPTSDIRGIDAPDVERVVGGLWDADLLGDVMQDVDDLFYCVVDARPWARDATGLHRINVDSLRTVLDAAVDARPGASVATVPMKTAAVQVRRRRR